MNKRTIQFIRAWLAKAYENIFVAEKLSEYEVVASVCFHYQQSVEKFLKAFLIAQEMDIRKTQ